ncbi:DegV family protein [Spiroplasma endosymbiont of Anurida maritima]|uniref:DegV family protein n=1 Tax=Spiroplasma endosymbiont of Anurida maritima TaxID=2967972 RepID=UPI0036D35BCE
MKKNIIILTDSCSMFTAQEAKDNNIGIIPLHIIYQDGTDVLDTEENVIKHNLYEEITKQETKTSQSSLGEIEEFFRESLTKAEKVIFIPVASNLSSQAQTALSIAAKDEFKDKIYVLETFMSASTAQKELALYGNELIKQGLDIEVILEKLKKYSEDTLMYLVPGDLQRFAKGGRGKKLMVNIISFLKIKLAIKWGSEPKKASSSRKIRNILEDIFSKLKEDMKKLKHNFEKAKIYFVYNKHCSEKTLNIIYAFLEENKTNFEESQMPNVVVAHAGLDTFGFIILPETK